MLADGLRKLIEASPEARKCAEVGDDSGCAAFLQPLMPWEPVAGRLIGELGILALFAEPTSGETVLQKLEAIATGNPIVARAVKWIQPSAPGIDLGHSSTRAMLDLLHSASVPVEVRLTDDEHGTLKRAGERQTVITANDVSELFTGRAPAERFS